MKIALVGTGMGAIRAPLKDDRYEVWGIPGLWNIEGNYKRIYEVHSAKTLTALKMPAEKGVWMANNVTHVHPTLQKSFPNAKVIDFEKHMKKYGRYFTSSFSWMLAEAIEEKPESIDIYGVTLSGSGEYSHQKPSASYLIGWARAVGITVNIDRESELMSAPFVYGYEDKPDYLNTLNDRKKELLKHIEETEELMLKEKAKFHHLEGAKAQLEWFENNFWGHSRSIK